MIRVERRASIRCECVGWREMGMAGKAHREGRLCLYSVQHMEILAIDEVPCLYRKR